MVLRLCRGCEAAGGVVGLTFLKNRGGKLWIPGASTFPNRAGSDSQEFFGSFFQKRTAFYHLPLLGCSRFGPSGPGNAHASTAKKNANEASRTNKERRSRDACANQYTTASKIYDGDEKKCYQTYCKW
jgi:hypothetical protein